MADNGTIPEPWIAFPTANNRAYGVYHFRHAVDLEVVPEELRVHVSADQRYNLFVNGERVAYGPAKGDLGHYHYDIIDLAPHLRAGRNVLAALVVHFGKDAPLALLSTQIAFLLRAEDRDHARLDSSAAWRVLRNEAIQPISYHEMLFRERWFYGFYACGPGDDVSANRYPWGWESPDYDDREWSQAEELAFDGPPPWSLDPRVIPPMFGEVERPGCIRQSEGVEDADVLLTEGGAARIAAGTKASLLIDWERLTMGYPELRVRGGQGASIRIRYAEALYDGVHLKAHRDAVEGKTMFGVWDLFRPDGPERCFRPLWKRCFRYMKLEIETGADPLEIQGLTSEYSGYPYGEMARFESEDDRLNRIFEMCQRTLRMCSAETYYDTPFYEQLSYGGDNVPIGATSFMNSADDRLFREVMQIYPRSVNRETGLCKSAYPSRFTFDMAGWSLAWIQSLHDYVAIRGDTDFARPFVEAIEGILGFFHRAIDRSTGLLGPIRSQSFLDWSITKGSIPRRGKDGMIDQSAMLSLFYALTLDRVAALYPMIGEEERGQCWQERGQAVKGAVLDHCWDEERGLFTDTPGDGTLSQHTNLLAILCDVIPAMQQRALMNRILSFAHFDERTSSFFSYYLFLALEKTGQPARILEHLHHWHDFIDRGFTTTGETGFASHDRSDCHAWSAHPAAFFLRAICGIQPGELGFRTVRIEPALGGLRNVNAAVPHPTGWIAVAYEVAESESVAKIELPEALEGVFVANGRETPLVPGANEVRW